LKFQAATNKQPSSVVFDNRGYKITMETSWIFRII
jgi:hypothetical protein